MPSTPKGFPYPTAADPVSSGAANIQALAQAIDSYLTGPASRRMYMWQGPATAQDTAASYSFWPGVAQLTIAIPAGMTHALIVWTITRIHCPAPAPGSGSNLYVKHQIGASVISREHNPRGVNPVTDFTSAIVLADELALGSYAGTSQVFAITARHGGSYPYKVDSQTQITLDVQFVNKTLAELVRDAVDDAIDDALDDVVTPRDAG
jgi:hypothetical protein